MRIGLVYKRFSTNGGSERQLNLLARELARAGHSVDVFCRSAQAAPPAGVRLHQMPSIPLGSFGELVLFSSWARRAMRRMEARSAPFDVTHAFGRTQGQDVYRLGGGCHPTYMAHAHALDRPAWLRRLFRNSPLQAWKGRRERRTLANPTGPQVITNSDMVREDLRARYALPTDRLHVVRNGVDLDTFRIPTSAERTQARERLGLSPEHRVLLFLGSGYARKGVRACLRAMAVKSPTASRTRLIVAGSDRRQSRWRSVAERLGVADRVIWRGAVSEPIQLYWASDCYTLPTTYDPAANSTLEALACGLPIVTTTMNGSSEILEPDVHGTVLETPVDPKELAAAWADWLGRDGRAAHAERARLAAEAFSPRAAAESMLAVYDLVRRSRREQESA